MRIVYLAGPFRAPTKWDVEQNVRAAESAALEVARLGFAFVCPHTMTRNFDGLLTDRYWLEMTLELMRWCDVVFCFSPLWRQSSGTAGEVAEAERLGIPVVYSLEELKRWRADDETNREMIDTISITASLELELLGPPLAYELDYMTDGQ